MAQYHFERDIAGESIRNIKIKNFRGRIALNGWDGDTVRLQCSVHMPGSSVPRSVLPGIRTEGDFLEIRSAMTGFKSPGRFEFGNFDLDLSWIESLGETARAAVKSFVSDFMPESGRIEPDDVDDVDERDIQPDRMTDDGREVESADPPDSEDPDAPGGAAGEMKTDMTVFVPRNASIEAFCLMGPIHARSLQGDVGLRAIHGSVKVTGGEGALRVKTLNGPVFLEDSRHSSVTAKSVNGPVKAAFRSIRGTLKLSTVNGPIRVTVPGAASVQLKATSTSGPVKISSLFTPEIKSLNRYTGRLGSGKHSLALQTVSGPISVNTSDLSAATSSDVPPPAPPEPPAGPGADAGPGPAGAESPDSPESIIDRMVASGRITPREAEQLRKVL